MERGFYFNWIVSAVAMYLAFYLWHGIILTDFYRVSYSKTLLLIFAAIAYLIISFVVYFAFHRPFLVHYFSNALMRAIFTGVVIGGSLFIITTVLGISFSNQMSAFTLFIDLLWQVLEQTLGALVIVLGERFIFQIEHENNKNQ